MGLSRYTKRAVKAVATGGLSETVRAGAKIAGKLMPGQESSALKGGGAVTIQPFDIGEITKGLKQTQAVTGRAIAPEAIEAATKGAIGAQIAPATMAAEKERERALDIERYNLEAEKESAAARAAGGGDIGALIGTGIGLATGGVAGGKVGAGVGRAGGGILANLSVLCTELERQGIMTRRLKTIAIAYRIKHIDNDVYEGYIAWATPLARLMQKSKFVTSMVSKVWIPVTFEMAHRMQPRIKTSWFGKFAYSALSHFSRLVFNITKYGRVLWLAH